MDHRGGRDIVYPFGQASSAQASHPWRLDSRTSMACKPLRYSEELFLYVSTGQKRSAISCCFNRFVGRKVARTYFFAAMIAA